MCASIMTAYDRNMKKDTEEIPQKRKQKEKKFKKLRIKERTNEKKIGLKKKKTISGKEY